MPDKKIDPLLLPHLSSKHQAPGDCPEQPVIKAPMLWEPELSEEEDDQRTVRVDLFGLITTIDEKESYFDLFLLPMVYPKAKNPAWERFRSCVIVTCFLVLMLIGMCAAPPTSEPSDPDCTRHRKVGDR